MRYEREEMPWERDRRTVRDCPGNRTENEWRAAVQELADKLAKGHNHCLTCGQSIDTHAPFHVSETEEWLPGNTGLPRGRWALSARAFTIKAAKQLQEFMGPRAKIWVRTRVEGNSTSYEEWKENKK